MKGEHMGAINYGASYIFVDTNGKRLWNQDITIGLKPTSDYSDEESGFAEWLELQKEDDGEFECDRSDYNGEQDDHIRENVEEFLEKAKMPEHYSISLESGYYEGFYLNIENDIPWVFDDSKEKQEYQKDITLLKSVLVNLVKNIGLTVVHPGWCMGYADQKDAIGELNEFIKNLRSEVNSIETYSVYNKRHRAA